MNKPITEKTQEELLARHAELVAAMDTITNRGTLITYSNAILAVEEELRRRSTKDGE